MVLEDEEDFDNLKEIDGEVINEWFSKYEKDINGAATHPFIGKKVVGTPVVLIPNKDGKETPEMFFEFCYFETGIHLYKNHYHQKIEFSNCSFEGPVQIKECKSDSGFDFDKCNFKSLFIVTASKLYFLLFEASCHTFGIYESDIQQCSLYSKHYDKSPNKIHSLTIDFRSSSGAFSISNIDVQNMEFYNTISKDTELLINEMKFQQLEFREMLNNGKIRLMNLAPLHRAGFSISRCNIGKCEFVNLDFRTVHFLRFNSVYLIDSTFINVIWPEHFDMIPYTAETPFLLDQKETYRQLKYAYSKQGDSVLEHKFHGLEMDKYLEYLKVVLNTEDMTDKSRYWKLQQNLLVLQLSNWTSDFGQSLWRPIRTIIIIGMPLYIITIICGGIDGYYFSFCNYSVKNMFNTFPGFLWFINPLRKYETSAVHWGLLPDFLMRIISSYCIFNFVRATRRFVK